MTIDSLLASPVIVGVLAGSLPTVSMLLCSLMAVNIEFTSTFESSAQNYCAGKTPRSLYGAY
jgi:hypothetical protein